MKTKEADKRKGRWYRFSIGDGTFKNQTVHMEQFLADLYVSDKDHFLYMLKFMVDLLYDPASSIAATYLEFDSELNPKDPSGVKRSSEN